MNTGSEELDMFLGHFTQVMRKPNAVSLLHSSKCLWCLGSVMFATVSALDKRLFNSFENMASRVPLSHN